MQLFFRILLLLGTTVSLHGKQVIKPEIVDLELPSCGKLVGSTLVIDVKKGKASSTNYAKFKINVKDYAAKHLTGKINVAIQKKLELQGKGKAGIKIRLSYPADDHSHERLGGSPFTKTSGQLSFGITLDPHAEWCEVQLGVINCSGKVSFDLNSFVLNTLFEKKNSDYICKYSDAVWSRPVHRGVMSPIRDQANEENFKVLKSWNVNLMRLQLNTSEYWARNNPEKYNKFIEEKIEKTIPQVLALGEKYGVKIIIDLHTVPGNNKMTATSDGIYSSENSVKKFIEIWQRIATKFKDHPALYGYDLMNEPKQTRKAKYDYWGLQKSAAEEIRKIDPETPIYIESNMMCSPLSFYYLDPLKLKNIIYEVHFYEPFDYTHYFIRKKSSIENGTKKYRTFPGKYYGTIWDSGLQQMRKKTCICTQI
eukprot:TRINITY_DN6277_c0_g1_i1.p1 TRINITY_DN6277_c0_g1~~TRINITY_DN6277_c0_g1_i1.p1  ORF type:complete len:423 (-),score=41.43 TRINITY_DN6277_c0_g1_i1:734-2002(-)